MAGLGPIQSLPVPSGGSVGTDPTFSTVSVNDAAYNATTWNGSNLVPTQNAVRDKIETLQPLAAKLTSLAAGTVGTSLAFTSDTLNTVQDIRTSVSPTFSGLNLTNGIQAYGGGIYIGTAGPSLYEIGTTTRGLSILSAGSLEAYSTDDTLLQCGGNIAAQASGTVQIGGTSAVALFTGATIGDGATLILEDNVSLDTITGSLLLDALAIDIGSNGNNAGTRFYRGSFGSSTALHVYNGTGGSGNNYGIGIGGDAVVSQSLTNYGSTYYQALGHGSSYSEGTGGLQGVTTLVSGTKAITITGISATTHRLVSLTTNAPGAGVLGIELSGIITSNTLTITSLAAAGTTVTTDVRTVTYLLNKITP